MSLDKQIETMVATMRQQRGQSQTKAAATNATELVIERSRDPKDAAKQIVSCDRFGCERNGRFLVRCADIEVRSQD